jgi:succinoglycan biosynthesis protein ExoL
MTDRQIAADPASAAGGEATVPQRIVFVSTANSQPRYHRRVATLLDAGIQVTVYTFSREYYGVNRYPAAADVVELGSLRNEGYLSRLPRLLMAARTIRSREQSHPVRAGAMYCFGFDSALLGLLARSPGTPLLYEVGDLRPLHFSPSIAGRLFRLCEGALLRQTAALVVTAPAFLQEYYGTEHPHVLRKAIVVENRLSASYFDAAVRPAPRSRRNGPIRVGIVGFLRYPRALLPLLESVSTRRDRLELHVYGDGPLRADFETAAAEAENIFYHGPFRSPADLAKIYETLDVNYVVYDNDYPNVRLLLPNKLYESIFFGVPMIVASNTALAERVLGAGAGVAVERLDEDGVGATLDQLDREALVSMSRNAGKVPISELVENRRAILSDILQRLDHAAPYSRGTERVTRVVGSTGQVPDTR